MTIPMRNDEPAPRPPAYRRTVDIGQLWAGGAATAVVAALIAIVGILVSRWVAGVPILAPKSDGAWGSADTGAYALAAAGAAIVATALMHLLMIATPRPHLFFAWILGLGTVIAVMFPFSTTAPLSQKVATALVNLALGIAIGSLVSGVAARATRRTLVRDDRYSGQNYPQSRSGDRYSSRDYPPTYPQSRSGDRYSGQDYPPTYPQSRPPGDRYPG